MIEIFDFLIELGQLALVLWGPFLILIWAILRVVELGVRVKRMLEFKFPNENVEVSSSWKSALAELKRLRNTRF